MRLSLALRSLPFLPMPYGQAAPQPGNPVDHPQERRLDRSAVASTIAQPLFGNLSTTTITVLTFVTPFPSAPAIPITSQSQVVTLYTPELTVCPIQSTHQSSATAGATRLSGTIPLNTLPKALVFGKRQAKTIALSYSFSNFSTNTSPTPSCSTLYSSTITPICYTTLTPLGGIPILATACDQNITFSTDIDVTTVNSRVGLFTTKYAAPWQSLVAGVPTGLVEAAVCNESGSCSTSYESWGVQTTEISRTVVKTVDINTVVSGPAEIIIGPSLTLTLSESTASTISLSTTFDSILTSQSLLILKETLPSTPTVTDSSEESMTADPLSSSAQTTVTLTKTSTSYITVARVTGTMTGAS